ncbi:MAG: ABC-2 family transporter protein [Oscillospiraceae bacterium]|jgi:ABC-2 type transport system permease protein|nr:ABC-2 family transporter protein [Oscillospiraceae bacterium]
MKVYLYSFSLLFKASFQYRFNTIIELLFQNVNVLITILFWLLIFRSGNQAAIRSYTVGDITTYFIVSNVFRNFIIMNSGWAYAAQIKSGDISPKLLKPYKYNLLVYFQHLAAAITGAVPNVILVSIALPALHVLVTLNVSAVNALFVLLFLVLSTITSHLVWSILGYLSFWTEEGYAIMWSFMVLFNLISGAFIPLEFFPEWSVKALMCLPTATWGYMPAKAFVGGLELRRLLFYFWINVAWCVILIIIQRLTWRRGTKKYSSVGG